MSILDDLLSESSIPVAKPRVDPKPAPARRPELPVDELPADGEMSEAELLWHRQSWIYQLDRNTRVRSFGMVTKKEDA